MRRDNKTSLGTFAQQLLAKGVDALETLSRAVQHKAAGAAHTPAPAPRGRAGAPATRPAQRAAAPLLRPPTPPAVSGPPQPSAQPAPIAAAALSPASAAPTAVAAVGQIRINLGAVCARRPMAIDAAERVAAEARLARGVATQFAAARAGAPVDVVLGVDFGTSATKIVVRAPYYGGGVPHAIPAPPFACAEENRYLWQTVLWLTPEGRFRIWPEPGAVPIEGIKAALMGEAPHRFIARAGDQASACALDAGVAYLAYAFRHARGWFLETKPDAYRRAPLVWQANIGLPAATYDDARLLETYRHVAAAAWLLSQQQAEITVAAVRAALNDARAIIAARETTARRTLGLEAVPEVAAEVAGFAQSTQRRDGLYVLIDVGATTLDVCTFRLHQGRDGTDRYSMFTADVETLGAEALRWFRDGGGDDLAFEHEVRRALQRVIWHTKRRRDPNAAEWQTALPVFSCGGGRASALHARVIDSLGLWLSRHTGAGGAPVLKLEPPPGFEAAVRADDFHRLAVAFGLSYPQIDIGQLDRPSDIDDIVATPVRDMSNLFVAKEAV